jgi:hypothetical protein
LVRFFSLPNRFKPNGPLPTLFILFLLWNTRTCLKKKNKYWPLLELLTQPNPIHIVDQVVYHKSHFIPVSFTPRCVINVKETHHQLSNNGRIVGVLIPPNTEKKNKIIISIQDHYPRKIRIEFLSRFGLIKSEGEREHKTRETEKEGT